MKNVNIKNTKRIPKKTIHKAIKDGTIQFIIDPNMEQGTVCAIGDYWFYFGGFLAEEMNPDEYQQNVPLDDIVNEICETLQEFALDPNFEDEYEYYLQILSVC